MQTVATRFCSLTGVRLNAVPLVAVSDDFQK